MKLIKDMNTYEDSSDERRLPASNQDIDFKVVSS